MPFTPQANKYYTPLAWDKSYRITDKVLGRGKFSEVRLAHRNGERFAVKIIQKSGLSTRELLEIFREVKVMSMIDHEHVVRFEECFEDEKRVLIVMEYAAGGELFRNAGSKLEILEEQDCRVIIKTVAEALLALNESGVVHRDLKPENILLSSSTKNARLLLADFGFAIIPANQEFNLLETVCGSPRYVAPEIMSGSPYNYKCDIWSLGVIAYHLVSKGELPIKYSSNKAELFKKLKKGEWDFTPEEKWTSVSDSAKDFISRLLVLDPEERFNYHDILSHSWLADVDTSQTFMTPNILRLRMAMDQEKLDSSKTLGKTLRKLRTATHSMMSNSLPRVRSVTSSLAS